VSQDIYIVRLRVGLTIEHDCTYDLVVDLYAPNGKRIRLADDNYIPSDAVYGLNCEPYGPGTLDDFIGMNAKGVWTLKVYDPCEEDAGKLIKWDLRILGTSNPLPTPTPTATPEGPSYCIADYFPIANGRTWNYSTRYVGSVQSVMAYPLSLCGKSTARVRTKIPDYDYQKDVHFSLTNNTLYNHGDASLSFCSPGIRYGDCNIRNGSYYTQDFQVGTVYLQFEFNWYYIGRKSVPAGTFDNCLKLYLSVVAYDSSSLEMLVGDYDVSTFAPGVGRIEFALYDEELDEIDTARLTSYSGTKMQSQVDSAPDLLESGAERFIAGPDQLIEAIMNRFSRKPVQD